MKNISFLPENFLLLEVKYSIYLNRRVFVMKRTGYTWYICFAISPRESTFVISCLF